MAEFDSWLLGYLESLNLDGEVYGGYISGTMRTLEGAGSEETEEALSDILGACLEDDSSLSIASKEIISRWQEHLLSVATEQPSHQSPDVDKLLPTAQPSGSLPVLEDVSGVAGAGEGLSLAEKRQLVAMYGCEESGDEEEEASGDPGGGVTLPWEDVKTTGVRETGKHRGGKDRARRKAEKQSDSLLQRNTNASSVAQADKQRREEEKLAYAAKLEKDRKSREQQRQKQQDRKEKEKKRTQKGERRR